MDLKEPLAYRMRPKTLEEFVGQEINCFIERFKRIDCQALFCGDLRVVAKLRLLK